MKMIASHGAGMYYGPYVPLTGRAGADFYGVKGIPVTTTDAPFEEEERLNRRRTRRRRRPSEQQDSAARTETMPSAKTSTDNAGEGSGRPSSRVPTDPERAICIATVKVLAETFPIHHRRQMTTAKLQKVAALGAASLYCDCLHDGNHEWPPALQPIRIAASADDRVEEREVFGQGIGSGDGTDNRLIDGAVEGS
jgi:hypothetical protein